MIARIRLRSYVAISIDTTCASVAETALEAGADIVNDISAGTDDPAMFSMVARRGAGIVLMHRLQPSAEESYSDKYRDSQHKPPQYKAVVSEVASFLLARAEMAMAAGMSSRRQKQTGRHEVEP